MLATNLPAGDVSTFTNLLKEAWNVNTDLGNRVAKLALLAGSQSVDNFVLSWSVTVNEEALYHSGTYYIKFKVRDLLIFKIVTLFSEKRR